MTVITVIQCMTDTLSMTVIHCMKNMTVVSFMTVVTVVIVVTEHAPSRAVFHKQILKPRQDGQQLFGAAVDNPFPFLPDHPHSRAVLADAFRTLQP